MDQCKTSSGDSEPSIREYVYIMLLVIQWMVQLATLYPSVGITGSSRLAVWSHWNLYNLLFCRPGPIEDKTLIDLNYKSIICTMKLCLHRYYRCDVLAYRSVIRGMFSNFRWEPWSKKQYQGLIWCKILSYNIGNPNVDISWSYTSLISIMGYPALIR